MSNKDNVVLTLDSGYVKLLHATGPSGLATMVDVANVARISFDGRDIDRTLEQELKLVQYLWDHQHTSPFEMIECWFEMKLPIFVARQMIRHRTHSVNEQSGRYTQFDGSWYEPEKLNTKPTHNKQGRGSELDSNSQILAQHNFANACHKAWETYKTLIEQGVCAEQARLVLPVNFYTKWVWKQDLRNLLHFLKLRLDEHAQFETRQYAQAMLSLVKDNVEHFDKINWGDGLRDSV